MKYPLLSIVIANHNYGRFLEEAIQSVLSQSCQDFELIVCDAASTDNSVEIIKKYSNRIAWWCSEPDGGQSAAFNKGFSHARGRFLTWLNADDVMFSGVIEELKAAVERDPQQEWFVGGVYWLDPQMRVVRCGRARRMSRIRAAHGLISVNGPSSFFGKDLYERAGKIDERFYYTMDTDLWLRFAVNEKVTYKPFIRYAWGLRLHPEAKMSGHNFNADGTLAANAFSAEALHKNEKKRVQLRKEDAWLRAKVPQLKRKMGRLASLLCADYIPAVMSRLDTRRVVGMPYQKALEIVG